jgi:hypothetical protein
MNNDVFLLGDEILNHIYLSATDFGQPVKD